MASNGGDIDTLKELLNAHYTGLSQQVNDVKRSVDKVESSVQKLSEDVYPRLNKAEQDIVSIKTDIGVNGISAKISEHADVAWARSFRDGLKWAGGTIGVTMLIAFLGWALGMYDLHGKTNEQPPQHQGVKIP